MKTGSKNLAFTLIEMLLVMAMIAIIASAVMVSVSSQRKRAQETRALAELSGVIQYILMCKSDGGTINSPNGGSGGGNICSLGAGYGSWPKTGSGNLNTFGAYSAGGFSGSNWYYSISNGTSRVCCNNLSSRCALMPAASACNASTVLE